jgi:hypothetical protein
LTGHRFRLVVFIGVADGSGAETPYAHRVTLHPAFALQASFATSPVSQRSRWGASFPKQHDQLRCAQTTTKTAKHLALAAGIT